MPISDALQQLIASADIAVGILLNADGSAVELLPLQPRPFPESTILALETKWGPRHLRFVGVMAWTDGAVLTQLEDIPAHVATRLNRSFQAYLTAFSTDSKVN